MYNKLTPMTITADQLLAYPLFAGLGNDELANLASVLVKRSFAKGTYLFHPGNSVLNMYLIESGMVRAFFTNSRGKEFTLTLLGPSLVVGMPLVREGQTRLLGASAATPLVTLVLAQTDLLRIAQKSPALMRNVHGLLNTYIQNLLFHVRSLVMLSVNSRLATVFLQFGQGIQVKAIEKDVIDLPLSQTDLASWIGASRGQVNRALMHLQELGLIHVDGQRIIILDRAGLEHMSDDLVSD